ncbi:MAG: saccharopine dehydrogenase C-terminal domain-containing protein [Holophaga sp.]|nr:saccharopine dehydrogenase C-terminal domain-containing protein [Holophaga sp.]
MKHLLILGAGRIARPCVTYLQKCEWLKLTIVEASQENLDRVTGSHPRTTTLNQPLPKDVAAFIAAQKPDLVLNLLPAEFRNRVAEACLKAEVNLMFPSYSDASIRAMEPQLKKSKLTWLIELGVDPGIDHMSAARTINAIHAKGGKVESFKSVCGAVPCAEANTNPWGYKLSWAPESLIGASRRTAKIMDNGKVVEWLDGVTYEHVHLEEVTGLGWYEVYANADSLPYLDTYHIPEAKSIYRGTIRYVGWSETIVAMNALGLFSQEHEDLAGLSFSAFTARKCGAAKGADAGQALCAKLGLKPSSAIYMRLKWLGYLDDRPLPAGVACSRDVVRVLFGEKLFFDPSERDLIILKDEVVASYPDGKRKCHTSTLIDFGIPNGDSSIARTTGLPPAIVAKLFLEGRIPGHGLVLPTLPELYNACLAELEKEGIRLQETTVDL